MTTIDAHVHLWERTIVDHPWLTPAAGVLDADFTIVDLDPLLQDAGVEELLGGASLREVWDRHRVL